MGRSCWGRALWMLSGRCHTPGAFLLCHQEVQKDSQQPPQRAKKIEVVWGAQEVMPAVRSGWRSWRRTQP